MSTIETAERGRWREREDGWELTFERHLRHPPERVWQALTTPDGLRAWFAAALIEPHPGGRMDLRFEQPPVEGFPDTDAVRRQANTVLAFEPFRLFEHSFGDPASVVTWRLEPIEGGTRLTLVHRVPRRWESDLSRTLSGWHHHLERFARRIEGGAMDWDWPRWRQLRADYAAAMEGR